MPNNIPFLDLVTPHLELKDEICAVVNAALETGGFIGGRMVQQFEEDFAKFCDTEHCVGLASGTDAVRFALTASGVQKGDVVVTVPHTFIATTEAISQAGAMPEFVDIDEQTYNLDPKKLQQFLEESCTVDAKSGKLISKKYGAPVTAVVPVHIYGQTADMDPILALAEKYNLIVVEDACQAHGAQYFSRKENRWRKAGSMGKAAAFSFYPGKNLGACGEGGAVTTNDAQVAKTIRMLRDHGQSKKYYHDIEGYNGRLDAIQAGILSVKLKHLASWNEKRREAAVRYRDLLAEVGDTIGLPYEPEWTKGVYHLFVVRLRDRDEAQKRLGDAGVGTGIHYPIPLHLQKAYANLGYTQGSFPVCERAAAEILSLPMFPGLSEEDQNRVVESVLDLVAAQSL